MTLHKVHWLANPADLVTKHLNQHMAKKHIELLDMWTEGGRAETALTLSTLARSALEDEWSLDPAWPGIVRVHRRPRKELFTPMRVPGAPAAASIAQVRVTRGKYLDNEKKFYKVDNWTRRDGKAHEDQGRRWVGTTSFLQKIR